MAAAAAKSLQSCPTLCDPIDCIPSGSPVPGILQAVLDVPFAPCRANAGLMLPCRDNDGAIRILNVGNLPFNKDLIDFHASKIEERAKAENRKASFQMVVDDVYAIGKGRLVGRPKY